jgi:hypothetical protein
MVVQARRERHHESTARLFVQHEAVSAIADFQNKLDMRLCMHVYGHRLNGVVIFYTLFVSSAGYNGLAVELVEASTRPQQDLAPADQARERLPTDATKLTLTRLERRMVTVVSKFP